MEFKLNRNNKILEVKICKTGESENKGIDVSSIEINPAYVPVLEDIMNGKKVPDEDTFLMLEEMALSEEEYMYFNTKDTYEMKASGLTLSGRNIYCFDLNFGKIALERIGIKKKAADKMILKNVKIKLFKDGVYEAKEASGLIDETEKDVTVSVSASDHAASVSV